jgi:hypothetical protein
MCSIVAAVDFRALGRFGWNWFPDSEIAFKAAISPENLIFSKSSKDAIACTLLLCLEEIKRNLERSISTKNGATHTYLGPML